MSHTKNINTIKICNIKLPGGLAGPYIFSRICQYLDIRSLLNFIETSLIKQLTKEFGSDDFKEIINKLIQTHPARELYLLIERYQRKFPRGTFWTNKIPTPIVCACKYGYIYDVKLFVSLHPYHKYITNRNLNGYIDDMTLKDMVSQVGKDNGGFEFTPLMEAAKKKNFQLVKYLIEHCKADPNIAGGYGENALHIVARYRKTNTELIELVLTHMTLDSINQVGGEDCQKTPLDWAYVSRSPLRQEIIALLRSKGGKANYFDENGRHVGKGNGDLND